MEPEALPANVFCGIDWAEDHHDVAMVDAGGAVLARLRIDDDATGYARLLALLATHGDTAGVPVPVAIETPRGLLVACLRAGRNPERFVRKHPEPATLPDAVWINKPPEQTDEPAHSKIP